MKPTNDELINDEVLARKLFSNKGTFMRFWFDKEGNLKQQKPFYNLSKKRLLKRIYIYEKTIRKQYNLIEEIAKIKEVLK